MINKELIKLDINDCWIGSLLIMLEESWILEERYCDGLWKEDQVFLFLFTRESEWNGKMEID